MLQHSTNGTWSGVLAVGGICGSYLVRQVLGFALSLFSLSVKHKANCQETARQEAALQEAARQKVARQEKAVHC